MARGLQPGLAFWDTAELQVVAPLMGTAHPTGFPTYVLLGWLASVLLQPFGEPAFRMNLFSAICVAVAAGVTVDLVRVLTRSRWIGVAGRARARADTAGLGDRHARRGALAAPRAPRHPAPPARRLGGSAARAPDDPRRERADRWLVAATVVFGLAVGNHSLTLLLAPADRGLTCSRWSRGSCGACRLVATCARGARRRRSFVVYLELPLRAGPFRAPLVYGQPDTWDGFRYIVLAEQFRGSVDSPFSNLDTQLVDLVGRTATEFGLLALLVPFGFIATAIRRPRYALLTGIALGLTVFFAASYDNADIERYYLGPILICWTWLAILVAAVVDVLAAGGESSDAWATCTPLIRPIAVGRRSRPASSSAPALVDFAHRARVADRSRDTIAQRWLDRVVDVLEPNAVVVELVELLDPAMVCDSTSRGGARTSTSSMIGRASTRILGAPTDVIDRYLGERPVYVIRDSTTGRISRR